MNFLELVKNRYSCRAYKSLSVEREKLDYILECVRLAPSAVNKQPWRFHIVVRLYDETPIHRDNFVKLVKEGYYDGTLFHRVIKDFMIQGGDPDSKGAPAGKMLGVGGPDYTLEAEIKEGLFHKRGALAAARQGDEVNPERRSSGSQFYIVWGQVYNEGQLRQFSKQLKMQKSPTSFAPYSAEILIEAQSIL